jgi:hypothetical protein
MKPEVKEAWLKALRSGEYQQATNRLRTNEGFCCLGVLCDIYHKQEQPLYQTGWWFVKDENYYMYNYSSAVLPVVVKEWAGLNDVDPSFGKEEEEEYSSHILSVLNDYGKNFNQIADLIEVHF